MRTLRAVSALERKSVSELEREIHDRLAELRRRASSAPPPKEVDVAVVCENWVRGFAWDETFSEETVIEELGVLARSVQQELEPHVRTRLVELWRDLRRERFAEAA